MAYTTVQLSSFEAAPFLIDTGVDSWESLDFGVNQPWGALVVFTGTYVTSEGSAAGNFNVSVRAEVIVRQTWAIYGGRADNPRLYIHATPRVDDVPPHVTSIRLDHYNWTLFKL